MQPQAVINGRLLNAEGRPQLDTLVRIKHWESGDWMTANTDPDGRFKIDELPAGKCELSACTGPGSPVVFAELSPKAGETTTQEWRMPKDNGADQRKVK